MTGIIHPDVNPAFCASCRTIPFENFRPPTLSEVQAIVAGQVDLDLRKRFFYDVGDKFPDFSISLGTLSQVQTRASSCPFCQLVLKILHRRTLPLAKFNPDVNVQDDALLVEVDADYFGYYAIPSAANQEYSHARTPLRLTIVVNIETPNEGSTGWRRISHEAACLQPCMPGASTREPKDEPIPSDPGADFLLFGGRRRPSDLKVEWLRWWRSKCKREHPEACRPPPATHRTLPDEMRFVDTRTLSICSLKDLKAGSLRYVALSYVWGAEQRRKLLKGTLNELSQLGALERDPPSATVQDAIRLTRMLGIDLIWVDVLCIIQDDGTDQAQQIQRVADIYRHAELTVIAAAGDAAAGLPGLRSGAGFREATQEEILVTLPRQGQQPGLALMTTLAPLPHLYDHYLAGTTWSTRGWTLQERMMSARALVFTKEQVYWTCNHAMYCEEIAGDYADERMRPFYARARDPMLEGEMYADEPEDDVERYWHRYKYAVEQYSTRNLTQLGDRENAFAATQQTMTRLTGVEFLWGLPRVDMAHSLAWTTFHGQQRHNKKTTLTDLEYPSWTWMAWVGDTYLTQTSESPSETSLIELYIYEEQPHRSHPSLKRLEKTGSELPNSSVFSHDIQKAFPQVNCSIPCSKSGILFFWAERAFLDLTHEACPKVPIHEEPLDPILPIVRSVLGENIGGMARMREEHWVSAKTRRYDQGRHEFIAIRRQHIAPGLSFSHAMIIVLQVVRDADGMCSRVNIGEIKEDAWRDARPERVLVGLK